MKSFESEIKKYAEKTRLKAIEREMMRDRILSYMEYHPLKKEPMNVGVLSSLSRQDFIYISFKSLWVKVSSGVLALLLIVGVPFLAERSVPGDVLYLVKTGVNEGVRTQLATSPYEKVALETKLIERRIAEARLLASEGKLTTEVEAQIAETVKWHAKAAQNEIVELRAEDTDGAAIAEIVFNSALEVQSAVLGQDQGGDSSSVTSILNAVNTARDEVASGENPTAPSYDGLMGRIESETTRAYELFTTVKKSATPEEITDIERRLSDIDRSIALVKDLKETDEASAVAQMVDVLGLIQKLITFMTNIDVREAVSLETLVPVILTPEERSAQVSSILSLATSTVREVEKKLPLIADAGVQEKVAYGISVVGELIIQIREALTLGAIDTAEEKSTEVQSLTDDLVKLTADIQIIEDSTASTTPLGIEATTSTTTNATVGTTTESVVGTTSIRAPVE